MAQRRILIITHDVVDEKMAGPAIRCWEFARILSRENQVTLATPHPTSLSPDAFELVQHNVEQLGLMASQSDLIILSGFALWEFPFLKALEVPLVVDIYDPFLLESLPLLSGRPDVERDRRHADVLEALTDLLIWGDFFVCASERQRDYWLGWLSALDRINPLTYDDDSSVRRLIDVVAFGVPDTPPQHTQRVAKGVRPGIAATDQLVVWGGGVYSWFDPFTLIRAMARVSVQRSDVKLLFLGIHHPNPTVDGSELAEQAVALSQELGLYNKCVFFNDWTPYDERQNYLLEANAGASLHYSHLETRFSFRTRLLDYFWAALPMIVTRGDVLSAWVKQHRLGWVVDSEDVDAVTTALLESAQTSRIEFQARFDAVVPQLRWETVMQPLIAFCQEPWFSRDRQRTRGGLQSLTTLKLISQTHAQQRVIRAKDEHIAYLERSLHEGETRYADSERRLLGKDAAVAARDAEIERLRGIVDGLRQGRVMRLLDGINHILRGAPLE
jgi:glycosyltransferase involved in cell wall biosynthesis